jgi:HK97 family phage prohead protease
MKSRKTETKEFKFNLSELDEEKGTFKGYASIWNEIDSYGDQVVKGAFKKSLRESKKFPMLWSHKVDEPMGVIGGAEDDLGLLVEGALNLEIQRARETRAMMIQAKDAGIPMGLSIGYQTIVEEIDKSTSVRKLKEVKLWEISPVVFPACLGARIGEVKSESDTEQEDIELKETSIVEGPEKSTPEAGPDTFHPLYVRAMAWFLKSQLIVKGK